MRNLLAIFAHPDDESFGPGGTLAKYAHEGVAVHYICATRGEAGLVDDALLQQSSIAELRTAELHQAANALGLASVNFLNYRDSGMPGSADNQHPNSLVSASLEEVTQRIVWYLKNIRPDVIVTHDQYGWYGHPDHIKIYEATLRAYESIYGVDVRSGQQTLPSLNAPRLYVSSFPKRLVKLAVRLMPLVGVNPREYGQNRDIDLQEIASWNVPLTTRINVKDYLAIKKQAAAFHASQRPLDRAKSPILQTLLERSHAVETFSRLYPVFTAGERMETDLFDRPAPHFGLWPSNSQKRQIPSHLPQHQGHID